MVTESEYGREKIIHPIQMKIFQRNNYKTDLNWPYFDNEPRIQVRTHLHDLQPQITFLQLIRHTQVRGVSRTLSNI